MFNSLYLFTCKLYGKFQKGILIKCMQTVRTKNNHMFNNRFIEQYEWTIGVCITVQIGKRGTFTDVQIGECGKQRVNPKRTGGGGWNPPPLDVSRDNFVEIFFRAASFHDFFLWSLAQLLALFLEKSGVRFQSYATLYDQASAQNLKIFWICVQNVWKMASGAKTPFWALKCSICFHYS